MANETVFAPIAMAYGTSGNVYPGVHVGAGNSRRWPGSRVVASLGANATWTLWFKMPNGSLPTGTAKFCLDVVAAATSGTARAVPSWASLALGESMDPAALNSETVTPDLVTGAAGSGDTITWGTGDSDQILQAKWTMNADTVVAGEWILMEVQFQTASWTLAQISTWNAYILFE